MPNALCYGVPNGRRLQPHRNGAPPRRGNSPYGEYPAAASRHSGSCSKKGKRNWRASEVSEARRSLENPRARNSSSACLRLSLISHSLPTTPRTALVARSASVMSSAPRSLYRKSNSHRYRLRCCCEM